MNKRRIISFHIEIEPLTSVLLIIATVLALYISNSHYSTWYNNLFFNTYIVKNFSLHNFVNDFLMSIFFLLAGLEIKEEVLHDSLSSFKKASFPIIASIGGVIMPAIIFTYFNFNTKYMNGVCIPISTDIAFSIGIYFLFSKYLNPSLKMFLLSLAVVDDLISIILIGLVYSHKINILYLFCALLTLLVTNIISKKYKIESILFFLICGVFLWYFIHMCGIHSTLSGILLSIVIPSKSSKKNYSPSFYIRKYFNKINNIIIIPLFAFANTGITIDSSLNLLKYPTVFLGIYLGLLIGKPLGIMTFAYLSSLFKITNKPNDLRWTLIFLVSLISSIGFTMSIFVSEVAFYGNTELIGISRICILITSFTSIIISSLFIKTFRELHII
ncbi:Na+/H+ antiporter NhaA [Terrisporobacter sp.]